MSFHSGPQSPVFDYRASGAAYSPDRQLLAIAKREKVWIINTRTGNVFNSVRSSR
jgi:hypothetical protein